MLAELQRQKKMSVPFFGRGSDAGEQRFRKPLSPNLWSDVLTPRAKELPGLLKE